MGAQSSKSAKALASWRVVVGCLAGLGGCCSISLAATASTAELKPIVVSAATVCAQPDVRVDFQDGKERVIEVSDRRRHGLREYWACWGHDRPGLSLGIDAVGSPGGDEFVGAFAGAVPLLAYEYVTVGPYGDSTAYVRVTDVQSGTVVRTIRDGQLLDNTEMTALVVAADASVAWIFDGNTYYVVVSDHHSTRIVASGTTIAPRSLRLSGSTVSWTHDGQTQSAALD